jgi:CheY-like chemotaxis protein
MKPRILIVEDIPLLVEDYREYISGIQGPDRDSLGITEFEIAEAGCVQYAKDELDKAMQHNRPFDLLLLDLGLPSQPDTKDPGGVENGLAVLKLAQNRRVAKDIVVVSKLLREPENVIQAVRAGAADFVDKDVPRSTLQAHFEDAVLRSLKRTVSRDSASLLGDRIRSLVPQAEQGLVDEFGRCFSHCIQEIGRAEDAIRNELRERLGLDAEQDGGDVLVQQLEEIDRSLQKGRKDWLRQQSLLGLSQSMPAEERIALDGILADLEKTFEPCLIVKNTMLKKDSLSEEIVSFNGDAQAVLSEMILGGLAELPDFGRRCEMALSAEVPEGQESWVDLVLQDNLEPLRDEDARNINKAASIGSKVRFDRAWGLSVIQYVALRYGGRLMVEPLSAGNIIKYRIPRASDGQRPRN